MILQTGSQVGRYRIDTLIASGGVGDVYRARDSRLGRHHDLEATHGIVGEIFDRHPPFADEWMVARYSEHSWFA